MKAVKLDSNLHQKLTDYCKERNLKIQSLVDRVMTDYLKKRYNNMFDKVLNKIEDIVKIYQSSEVSAKLFYIDFIHDDQNVKYGNIITEDKIRAQAIRPDVSFKEVAIEKEIKYHSEEKSWEILTQDLIDTIRNNSIYVDHNSIDKDQFNDEVVELISKVKEEQEDKGKRSRIRYIIHFISNYIYKNSRIGGINVIITHPETWMNYLYSGEDLPDEITNDSIEKAKMLKCVERDDKPNIYLDHRIERGEVILYRKSKEVNDPGVTLIDFKSSQEKGDVLPYAFLCTGNYNSVIFKIEDGKFKPSTHRKKNEEQKFNFYDYISKYIQIYDQSCKPAKGLYYNPSNIVDIIYDGSDKDSSDDNPVYFSNGLFGMSPNDASKNVDEVKSKMSDPKHKEVKISLQKALADNEQNASAILISELVSKLYKDRTNIPYQNKDLYSHKIWIGNQTKLYNSLNKTLKDIKEHRELWQKAVVSFDNGLDPIELRCVTSDDDSNMPLLLIEPRDKEVKRNKDHIRSIEFKSDDPMLHSKIEIKDEISINKVHLSIDGDEGLSIPREGDIVFNHSHTSYGIGEMIKERILEEDYTYFLMHPETFSIFLSDTLGIDIDPSDSYNLEYIHHFDDSKKTILLDHKVQEGCMIAWDKCYGPREGGFLYLQKCERDLMKYQLIIKAEEVSKFGKYYKIIRHNSI